MMRKALGCILVAGMVVAMLPSAVRAESEVTHPEAIFDLWTVQNARGVEVEGQVAIYFDVPPVEDQIGLGCGLDEVDMAFVLRLRKDDGARVGFAGVTRLCLEDDQGQIRSVVDFVKDIVIPFFFPNAVSPTINLPTQPCPRLVTCISLTAVKNMVLGPPILMDVKLRVRR